METKSIIVIGMHRSGTSALSGELARLGVFMGKTLLKPQAGVNDKGFWENARLLEINEQVLDWLNSSWDDPLCLRLGSEDAASIFNDRACRFVADDYSGSALWGMKDPRVSILLPFWMPVLKQSGVDPNFILMIRNPLEVAGSLSKRDGFSEDKGLMLWINYNLCSYYQTLNESVILVDFSDLLENPHAVSERIAKSFQLSFDATAHSDSFIDKRLKRQSGEISGELSTLSDLAMRLYQGLLEKNGEEIDAARKAYEAYMQAINPVMIEHLGEVKRSEVHFRTVFEKAYYSYSWKITRGLRWVEDKLRQVG